MRHISYNKYGNTKVKTQNGTFASVKEYRRHCELKLLERAGQITDLQTQVSFELIPAQYETFERYGKRGQRLKDGKRCIEKSVKYVADFVYTENGKQVVEDAKSTATKKKESYIIKRKLMLHRHNIRVKEV